MENTHKYVIQLKRNKKAKAEIKKNELRQIWKIRDTTKIQDVYLR